MIERNVVVDSDDVASASPSDPQLLALLELAVDMMLRLRGLADEGVAPAGLLPLVLDLEVAFVSLRSRLLLQTMIADSIVPDEP